MSQSLHTPEEELRLCREELQKTAAELKQATAELEWKTTFMEALANSSIDGILVVDPEGGTLLQNQRLIELFRMPPEIARGRDDGKRVQWAKDQTILPEEFATKVNYLHAHPEESSHDEIELKHGVTLGRHSAPVLDGKGVSYGRIWTFHDITERKKTENALREQSALLGLLMENSNEKIYFKDLQSRFVYFSGHLRELFQVVHSDDLKGKTDFDLYTVEHAGLAFAAEQEIIRSGKPLLNQEEKEVDLAGRVSWVLTSKMPWRDQTGRIVGTFGISRDITGRKEMEEELRRTQNELRLLFDVIPVMICFKDTENRILRINKQLAGVAGKAVEEIEGLLVDEVFPDSSAKYYTDDLEVIRSREPKLGIVETVRDREGREITIQTDKVPVFDETGKVNGLVVMAQDITERMKIEEALRRGQAELRVLFDLVPAMIWFKDTKNGFLRVNQRVAEATGLSIGEIEGKSAYEIFPLEAAAYYADDQEVIRSGVPKLGIVERLRGPRGQDLWVRMDKVPVLAEDGNVIGLVAAVTDVTERKVAEDELRWKTAFLEAQISSSSDGIIVVDPRGKKISQNQQAVELFKIPSLIAEDPDDQKQVDWITGTTRDPEAFAGKIAYLYAHPDKVSHDEIYLKDGTVLDRYSSPVIGNDGTHYGRIWTFRNITGRKQDEEALRENEERFSGAFEHAPIGVALVSPEGRWLKVNRVLCGMLGYSEEQLLNRRFQDVTHPDDLKPCLEHVQDLITGKVKTCQSEKRYIHRDGHSVPVAFNLSLVRDEGGRPRYLVAQIQDISIRKRAEEKLVANEILLRQFVQYTPAAIAMLDLQMRYIQVSDRWMRDYHLLGREIIGKSHYELFPDVPQRWREIHQRVLAGEVERCEEDPFPRADGSIEWLQWEARPWREAGGEIGGIIFFTQVITDRKRAEEALLESKRFAESIAENSTSVIYIFDLESGKTVYSNRIAAEHLGYSKEQILEMGEDLLSVIIHPADLPLIRENLARFAQIPDGRVIDLEYRIKRASGEWCWMWSRETVFKRRPDGSVWQIMGTAQDITDRKQNEEKLRLLGTAVEQSKEAIVITDAELDFPGPRMIFVNPAYTKMTGYSSEEAVGKTPRILQGPLTDRAVLDRLRTNLRRGEEFLGETINYRKNGEPFCTEWQIVHIRDQGGNTTHYVAVQRDVTERRRMESALRESEERFRSYFELGLIGMAITSPAKGWIEVNDQICLMLGYDRDELLKISWAELTHPEDLARDLAQLNRVVAGEIDGYSLDKRFLRKDGGVIDATMSAKCLRHADGAVDYFVVLLQDITARKLADEELSQSRERLRGILDHIPQRVFWKNRDFIFQGCNRAFAADFGFTDSNQVIGKTDFDMIEKKLAERYRTDDREVIELDAAKFSFEEPGDLRNGHPVWLRTSKVPLHDQQGRVSGILGTYEDVTEAKLAKLEIEKLETHLIQSQKLETVGKLAGGIAHEFNSILTAIIGQSDLLLKDLASGNPLVKNVMEINKAAGRAAVLTRQLLAYGRKQMLLPEILDLNRVVAGMEEILQHLMGEGVDIRVLNSGGTLTVKADAGQIEQVIMNIAINARDAMPGGGRLTLEICGISVTERSGSKLPELIPGEYACLSLTDTGLGMNDEVRARLFEPFFSTKGVGEGTGLGLSTCYGIVKQSGGHIGVESEPGRGATFRIYLPRVQPEVKLPLPRITALDLPKGTETILLRESDLTLREMAANLLRRLGYTVLEGGGGSNSLSLKTLSDGVVVDLLLLDAGMPDLKGKDVAAHLKADYPQARILWTSTSPGHASGKVGKQDEAAVLPKPFTPAALAQKVREVLDFSSGPTE